MNALRTLFVVATCSVLSMGGMAATAQEEIEEIQEEAIGASEGTEWPAEPTWSGETGVPERVVLELTETSGRVMTMGAAVPAHATGGLSGLFYSDGFGRIRFQTSRPSGDGAQGIKPITRFHQPAGLAVRYPLLYVYDRSSRQIWTVDLENPDQPSKPLRLGYSFGAPSHFAVSPHGLIAIAEGDRLTFLQEGHDPIRYDRSRFPNPAGLVFSAWDTVLLLDRARESLVTITLVRRKDGGIDFLSENELDLTQFGDEDWQEMTALDGTPYLASRTMVYAYLEADRLLIPLLPLHPSHQRVRQIALTREKLYLLDDDHLDSVARPQPVDLLLEGSPESSQDALVEFYRYLFDRNMLPVRRILVRSEATLENVLLAEGVLIAPSWLRAEGTIRVYDPYEHRPAPRERALPNRESGATGSWEEIICELNTDLCGGSFRDHPEVMLEPGTELTVPDIRISSRLSRERILLDQQPLGWYLERLVFSPEFGERSQDPQLIRTLNPNLESFTDDDILELSRGSVVVPVERWAITAAVPATDHANLESPLWHLVDRFEGVSVSSRASYVELALRSLQPLPPPDGPSSLPAPADPQDPEVEGRLAAACDELKARRADWLETINYPVAKGTQDVVWPAVLEAPVLVGILEYGSTLLRTHQAFSLDPDRPTWYTARDLSLTAQPDAASLELANQIVEDLATYSPESHHGTHVAALIAGRLGACWSGLTPSARLVLIDLTDSSSLRRSIIGARDVNTLVFNVSQEFAGDQKELHKTILESRRILFVAAAGNSTANLDTAPAVPAPARWGELPNVIVVAASDWNGTIIPQIRTSEGIRQGSNFGKRYIDLIAPADSIFSASAQRKYGPATGTSQAAPQVAAAAALLVDRWRVPVGDSQYRSPLLAPGDAKARLIATADWKPEYEGKVWGGMLDFGAAVMFPELNHLRTRTGAAMGELYTFTPANDPKIVVTNAPSYYERWGRGAIIARDKIPFSQILALTRLPNGLYRMVLREPRTNRLKIVLDADLEDDRSAILNRPLRIKCSSFSVFHPETGRFERDDSRCSEGISVQQIEDYVLGEPYQIDWEVQVP